MAEPTPEQPLATADDFYAAFANKYGDAFVNTPDFYETFVMPVLNAGMTWAQVQDYVGSGHVPGDTITVPKPAPGDTGPTGPEKAGPGNKIAPVTLPVSGAATDILNQLWSKVLDIAKTVSDVKAGIEKQVADAVGKVLPPVEKALADVQHQLGSVAGNLIPDTLHLVGVALGGVESIVSALLSSAADIGDITTHVTDVLVEHQPGIESFLTPLLGGGVSFGVQALLHTLFPPTNTQQPFLSGIESAIGKYVRSIGKPVPYE